MATDSTKSSGGNARDLRDRKRQADERGDVAESQRLQQEIDAADTGQQDAGSGR